MSRPGGVAADSNGYVYTNDYGNNRVLKIDSSGNVVEQYGNSEFGYEGDGQDFSAVRFNKPYGVTVKKDGSEIYIPDFGNRCVRCIDIVNHEVRTVFRFESYKDLLGEGNAYWVDIWKNRILCIADGVNNHIILYDMKEQKIKTLIGVEEGGYKDVALIEEASYFNIPAGITVDEKESFLYIADYANNAVRRVDLNKL